MVLLLENRPESDWGLFQSKSGSQRAIQQHNVRTSKVADKDIGALKPLVSNVYDPAKSYTRYQPSILLLGSLQLCLTWYKIRRSISQLICHAHLVFKIEGLTDLGSFKTDKVVSAKFWAPFCPVHKFDIQIYGQAMAEACYRYQIGDV